VCVCVCAHAQTSFFFYKGTKALHSHAHMEQSPRICHILCHKPYLNTFKRTEITRCLSDQNGIKLKINNKKINGKPQIIEILQRASKQMGQRNNLKNSFRVF
jgi:hypothetical protein